MFHEGLSIDDVETRNNQTSYEFMLRIDKKYKKYCSNMEMSKPKYKIIAMFLLKMESYLLCKYAIHKSDPIIAKQEGCESLSIWKVHGKQNYLEAALHRIETLYYDMDPWMLEVMPLN